MPPFNINAPCSLYYYVPIFKRHFCGDEGNRTLSCAVSL
jgi:hypothetical protein